MFFSMLSGVYTHVTDDKNQPVKCWGEGGGGENLRIVNNRLTGYLETVNH